MLGVNAMLRILYRSSELLSHKDEVFNRARNKGGVTGYNTNLAERKKAKL